MRFSRNIACCLILFSSTLLVQGQVSYDEVDGRQNVIESTVPFLSIAPDSRGGSMGDAGVATSPDNNSQHWNPSKYAFIDGQGGITLTYTPWLRNIVNDINLAYLAGYYRVDRQQVVSGSLRYFSLGSITFTDNEGNPLVLDFRPNEFAVDLGYSRLFSEYVSGGMAFRFIRSDLSGRGVYSGVETKPGIAYAADISAYYHRPIEIEDKDAELSFGVNISNIGTKISYTEGQDKSFIPINLKLGSALKVNLDDYNSVAFALDLNKMLVPTSPIYYAKDDILPNGDTVQSNQKIIKYGYDPNVSSTVGMIRSFYDAPGGFKEELHEIMYSVGAEYWYRNQFALRGGYFHEHQTKGNRKYFTMGVGLRLNVFELDFAYLVPTSGRQNPLANTVRISLAFNFDKASVRRKN
jgi:hypothetical protein